MIMRSSRGFIAFSMFIIITLCLVLMLPSDTDKLYIENFVLDVVCTVVIISLLIFYNNRFKTSFFDPIYFISGLYLMMYFITPIYDILTKEYLWYGYNLFPYGVKATIIEFLGYVVFYIFYSSRNSSRKSTLSTRSFTTYIPEIRKPANRRTIMYLIMIMYAVCFVANVMYLLNSGYTSLTYILTLGLFGGNDKTGNVVSNIGFVSMFSYCLPTITLLYWEYGKSKALKIILFVPMLMLQVARGFRFFVIQIFITFVAHYFIRNRRKIALTKIIGIGTIMIVAVLLMTMFRVSIRGGNGMDLSAISASTLTAAFDDAFWENLRIYKNFYGMVNAIPSEYGYVWGRQLIIGTIVMVIPRILWPGKISSYGGVGLFDLIGSNLYGTGQAYSTIGEYYYAAGVFGVCLFMAIFGLWGKKLRDKYMNSNDELDIITFSVLLGCILQLMIRGYFPSNFWYLVFALIPIWVVKYIRVTSNEE